MTSTELEAVEHLEQDGPLTQRQLADRLSLTSGGTTLLVDRLEHGGLVSRRPHPTDRRAVLVELNRAAAAQISSSLDRYHDAVTAATRSLSAAERDATAAFLDAITAAAADAAERLRTTENRRRHERRGRTHSGRVGRDLTMPTRPDLTWPRLGARRPEAALTPAPSSLEAESAGWTVGDRPSVGSCRSWYGSRPCGYAAVPSAHGDSIGLDNRAWTAALGPLF